SVPHHGSVRHEHAYPGIDIKYYGRQHDLEYDFIVAPGADPARIAFTIDGAERIAMNTDGDVVIGAGGRQLQGKKPVAYQELAGVRTHVASAFALEGSNTVRVQVATYDHSRELVIDPVLQYSTYLGGGGEDWGKGLKVDASGNAYIVGVTGSVDF